MIVGDLALPVLLRHIVDSARELVGARYAALGVIAAGGGLAEFVHAGMPPDVVAGIGHLPRGEGLLGALIDTAAPIRLRRIAEDSRSSGFPDGHPPMDSFLGVPIRVRGTVFGNLYLCGNTSGEFSGEDEELLTALAATAGVAIDNARLYDVARIRQDWLRASATITRRLLSAEPGDPLRLIAELAREIARPTWSPSPCSPPTVTGCGSRWPSATVQATSPARACRCRGRCSGGCSAAASRCGVPGPSTAQAPRPRPWGRRAYRGCRISTRFWWCRWWVRTGSTG